MQQSFCATSKSMKVGHGYRETLIMQPQSRNDQRYKACLGKSSQYHYELCSCSCEITRACFFFSRQLSSIVPGAPGLQEGKEGLFGSDNPQ